MATAILTNVLGFTNLKRSKIHLATKKKEFSMVNTRSVFDCVSAKERMRIPFSYKWLKFKTKYFGLKRGTC